MERMKLKNKKTGEIIEISSEVSDLLKDSILNGTDTIWEIVDEERWYINENGGVLRYMPDDPDGEDLAYMMYQDAIGNHFKSKEEAEQAVEKLKAWKRLKDKGFRFDGYDVANRAGDNVICGQVYFKAGNYDREEIEDDLFLLFGGEE